MSELVLGSASQHSDSWRSAHHCYSLELTGACRAERGVNLCAKDCTLCKFRGPWVAFQHVRNRRISGNRHRNGSTIDGQNCFQTRGGHQGRTACTMVCTLGGRSGCVYTSPPSPGEPPQLMAHHRKIRLLRRRRCCWAPRRSSQARGRANGDAAALRVEPRRGGGRLEDCPDLKSGSAAHVVALSCGIRVPPM